MIISENNISGLPCPGCDFFSIDEPQYGTFNICNICGWEDNCVQLANPTCQGGANEKSLIEHQIKPIKKCPLTINQINGIYRDKKWRPLNAIEINIAKNEKNIKY